MNSSPTLLFPTEQLGWTAMRSDWPPLNFQRERKRVVEQGDRTELKIDGICLHLLRISAVEACVVHGLKM